MAYVPTTFQQGVFTYTTFVTRDGRQVEVSVKLDVNHAEVRDMIDQAISGKTGRTRRANGALVVKVTG